MKLINPLNPPSSYYAVELSQQGPIFTKKDIFTPIPSVYEKTVILRPLIVGICNSDVKEVMGVRKTRKDFGHEIVGMISKNPHTPWDFTNIVCLDPHIPINRTTGFGEYVMLSSSNSKIDQALKILPEQISPEKLVFCEPLSCVQHCISKTIQMTGLKTFNGLCVGIWGAGIAGVLLGLILEQNGASVVYINRDKARIEFVRSRGIIKNLNALSDEESARDLFDIVIISTSIITSPVFESSIHLIKKNGIIMLYGGTNPGQLVNPGEINIDIIRRQEKYLTFEINRKVFSLGGSYGALSADFEKAVDYFEFPIENLITKKIRLKELPTLLVDLSTGKKNYGKVVVDFR